MSFEKTKKKQISSHVLSVDLGLLIIRKHEKQ